MPSMPDAVILCGGAGLRLRSVIGDGPKSMASIADRPFLELLLKQLRRHGVNRVVLAVGYQEDLIRAHFGEQAFGLNVVYSSESTPLGTAGALRNALDLIHSNNPLVMNGDSYTDTDLGQVVANHHRTGAEVSLVVFPVDGRRDSGLVLLDEKGNLKAFEEKPLLPGLKYANAGIYVIGRKLIADIPPAVQMSIEREVFPRWLSEGKRVAAVVSSVDCVDIGTPERYQSAQNSLADVEGGQCEEQHGDGI